MEPNKVENHFKKQLNSREIQPSQMAWQKLDAMLTEAEKNKPKQRFAWIYIAASLVGLALVSTVFFNDFETEKINRSIPVVLEQNANSKKTNEVVLSSPINKKIIKEYQVVNKTNNLKNKTKESKNKKNDLLIINPSKENVILVHSSENGNTQSIIRNKYISAEKLLAEVSNSKFESKTIDDTKTNRSKGISVNPNDLLSGVETELNQSYRESALERLSKNFKAIKTVLVNRNYQE